MPIVRSIMFKLSFSNCQLTIDTLLHWLRLLLLYSGKRSMCFLCWFFSRLFDVFKFQFLFNMCWRIFITFIKLPWKQKTRSCLHSNALYCGNNRFCSYCIWALGVLETSQWIWFSGRKLPKSWRQSKLLLNSLIIFIIFSTL